MKRIVQFNRGIQAEDVDSETTVLTVYFLFGFLPQFLCAWNVQAKTLLSIFSVLLLTVAIKLWSVSNENFSMKTVPVGDGGDTLFVFEKQFDPVGGFMKDALTWIEKNSSGRCVS